MACMSNNGCVVCSLQRYRALPFCSTVNSRASVARAAIARGIWLHLLKYERLETTATETVGRQLCEQKQRRYCDRMPRS